jgi:uncharacterized protein DUF4330
VAVIDADGRVFGRVNVIDAGAIVLLAAMIPLAIVALLTFRTRPLLITGVVPRTLTVGSPMRVQVKGEQFRPYLQAFVERTGQRFMIDEVDRSRNMATYLLSSPELVELHFPEIIPGTYDLYFTEHSRVVASSTAAIVVAQPPAASAEQLVKVQFYPPPEGVPLIRTGDRDVVEPRLPTSAVNPPATIVAVEPKPERREVVDMHLLPSETWYGQPMLGQLVEVTLRVPVSEIRPGAWTYNEDAMRVGRLFTMTTDRYQLRGVITWVGEVKPTAGATSR